MSSSASLSVQLDEIGGSFHPDTGLSGLRLPASHTQQQLACGPEWLIVGLADGTLLHAGAFTWTIGEWPQLLDVVDSSARIAVFSGVASPYSIGVEVALSRLTEAYMSWQVIVENWGHEVVHTVDLSLLRSMALPADWIVTVPWGAAWAVRAQDLWERDPIRVRYPVQGSMQW